MYIAIPFASIDTGLPIWVPLAKNVTVPAAGPGPARPLRLVGERHGLPQQRPLGEAFELSVAIGLAPTCSVGASVVSDEDGSPE